MAVPRPKRKVVAPPDSPNCSNEASSATPTTATMDEGQLEHELLEQCGALERQLKKDPLSFENSALEVQLVQMQDDFSKLQDDYRDMDRYIGERLDELNSQLAEQKRSANLSEGHAAVLEGLLDFHEEQGRLTSNYWKTQCEKRDESINFLKLKLQEYTTMTPIDGPSNPQDQESDGASEARVTPAGDLRVCYRQAALQYSSLCEARQECLAEAAECERELLNNELSCAGLKAAADYWRSLSSSSTAVAEAAPLEAASATDAYGNDDNEASTELPPPPLPARRGAAGEGKELEDICGIPRAPTMPALEDPERERQNELIARLDEVRRKLVASISPPKLPTWVQRCASKGDLEVKAEQLERISKQVDAAKRSLDASNEELQWQATSAETLRMRIVDLLYSARLEKRRAVALRAEFDKAEAALEELRAEEEERAGVLNQNGGTSR